MNKQKHKTIKERYEEFYGKPLEEILSHDLKVNENERIVPFQEEIDWGDDVGEEVIE